MMNLEHLIEEETSSEWGSKVEKEIRLRIKLSVAAWAYEIASASIMTDHDFDKLCLEVDTSIDTGNAKLDKFFKEEFSPHTGQWVHKHPEKQKLKVIYYGYYAK